MGGQTYEYSDMLIIEYIYTDTYAHTLKKKNNIQVKETINDSKREICDTCVVRTNK